MKKINGKRYVGRFITAIFLATVIILSVVSPVSVAFAMSAVSYGGSTSFDIAVRGEKCPLEVEKKKVSFDIVDFPKNQYDASNENYKSTISLEYNFYNPASEDVTATFAVPIPDMPYYMGDDDYEKLCASVKVTVNGEAVETAFRYTYNSHESDYADVKKILDDYRSDDFYKKDLSVTKYTFTFSGIDEEEYRWATAVIDFKNVDSNITKYSVAYTTWGTTYYDGGCKVSMWARKDNDAIVYVLGDDVPFTTDSVTVYTDDDRITKLSACNVTVDRAESTLSDVIFEKYDENGKISKIDYFNLATDYMKEHEFNDGRVMYFDLDYYNVAYFRYWIEYKLTIPAGGRAVNIVTSPVYPDLIVNYEPTVYSYRCSLTSPETWAKFGIFEAEIKTPYYVYESDGWTKTDEGYKSGSEVLSYNNKLDFSLCTTEAPRNLSRYRNRVWIAILVGLLLLFVIPVIGGAVAVIIIIATSGNGKSNEK